MLTPDEVDRVSLALLDALDIAMVEWQKNFPNCEISRVLFTRKGGWQCTTTWAWPNEGEEEGIAEPPENWDPSQIPGWPFRKPPNG